MSDNKTEEPTDEKLRKSKKKGQVAQTKNQVASITLITGSLTIYGIWPVFKEPFLRAVDLSFSNLTTPASQKAFVALEILQEIFVIHLAAFFIVMIVIVFLSTLFLTKFTVSAEVLMPKVSKLNPVSGFKNIFKLNSLYTIAYTLCITLVFAVSLYTVLKIYIKDIIYAYSCNIACLFILLDTLIVTTIMIISILLIIFAVLDIPLQKLLFLKDQKMSKDEVKRENKEMMGSPEIIGSRKEIANEVVFGFDPKDVTLIIFGGEVTLAYIYGGEPNDYPYLYKKVIGPEAGQLKDHYAMRGIKVEYSARVANRFAVKNQNEDYLPEEFFYEFIEIAQKHNLVKT